MMKATIRTNNGTTTIEILREQYPKLVIYDGSGWEIEDLAQWISDGPEYPNQLWASRALIWENEEESENDDGSKSIAEIVWE